MRVARRQRAKNDIWFFAEYYFPHILKEKTPDFHREIVDLLQNQIRLGIAAPRGYAKSTLVFGLYAMHCLLFNQGEDILIISQSDAMAVEQLTSKIRQEFEQNDRLFEDFSPVLEWGDKESSKWTNDHLVIFKEGKVFSQIRAKGRGCQVRGFRPSRVICDDLEDDEEVKSEDQRKDLKNWFLSALFNVMRPEAQIIVIGTLLHPLALLAEIVHHKEPFERWKTKKYKALLEGDKSLWPELYDAEKLVQKRKEIGTYSFEKEYQNNPISSDICLWKPEWIKKYDFHHKPKFIRKFAAMDIAASEKQSADYTALCCVGETADGRFYEIETVRGRWGTWDIVSNIMDFFVKHNPERLGTEENVFHQLIKPVLLREAEKRNVKLRLEALSLGNYSDAEKKMKTPRDKRTRAMSVIQYWENGQVYIKTDFLYEEMAVFPTGAHDDSVDAIVYCMRMFQKYGAKSVVITEEIPKAHATSFQIIDNQMPNLAAMDEEYYRNVGPDWKIG